MIEQLRQIEHDALKEIETSGDKDSLEKIRIKYLGREKGELTKILRSLGDLSLEEKRKIGPEANTLRKEIEKANKKVKGIAILQGTEVDISSDGSVEMEDNVLKQLDVVVASVHSGFKTPKDKMTRRVIKAMENEHVDIIAHPTGRLIQKREPFEIDLDMIFDKAKETGTVLEINAYPERLDLKDSHVRAAIKAGVKLVISTDAHQAEQLHFMRFGIATARRGWAEKKDIINVNSLKEMMKMLK